MDDRSDQESAGAGLGDGGVMTGFSTEPIMMYWRHFRDEDGTWTSVRVTWDEWNAPPKDVKCLGRVMDGRYYPPEKPYETSGEPGAVGA